MILEERLVRMRVVEQWILKAQKLQGKWKALLKQKLVINNSHKCTPLSLPKPGKQLTISEKDAN